MTNKDAIRIIKTIGNVYPKTIFQKVHEALNLAIKALENERPQGHWIYKNPKDYECSCCGYSDTNDVAPYCWYCGAKMAKGGERQ